MNQYHSSLAWFWWMLLFGNMMLWSPMITAFTTISNVSSKILPSRRCNLSSSISLSASTTNEDHNDVTELAPHYTSDEVLSWLQKMAASYKLERGEDLLEVIQRESSTNLALNDSGDDENEHEEHLLHQLANACAKTNLPMASHDFLRDPSGEAIYNYGNMAFLHGFGYEWEEFVRLPSRKCVDTEEDVEERQRLLDAVKDNAMIKSNKHNDGDDPSNNIGERDDDNDNDSASKYDNLTRVRKDGKKILLRGVNLWNVYDICLQDIDESSGSSTDLIREQIEKGQMKAIGQAVWIRHVDNLD